MKRITALFFVGFFSGCGYTFTGSGSVLPKDVTKIYIPFVENDSTETNLSSIMTEALRDQFERYGVVSVVDDSKDADAVLKTRIVKLARNTQSTTGRTDIAAQYDSTMTVSAELRRTNGQILWRQMNMQVNKAFGATGSTVVASSADFASGSLGSAALGALDTREVQRGQEQQALETLVSQAARKIYDDAVAPDF